MVEGSFGYVDDAEVAQLYGTFNNWKAQRMTPFL
jgi:hypothetical protein